VPDFRRRQYRYPGKDLATELAEATAVYGQEMVIERFVPMTPTARSTWKRARRKPGRPRRGKGVEVISVSIERGLLHHADRLAQALGVSRARLIERGLKVVLAASKSR
jgi:hypothetical protein